MVNISADYTIFASSTELNVSMISKFYHYFNHQTAQSNLTNSIETYKRRLPAGKDQKIPSV